MTRALSAKAQQSEATREAIVQACLALFAQRGFASTSLDQIAQAAGITKGAIYWHFDSKDALFQAILGLIRSRWHEVVLRRVPETMPPRARLEALFDSYIALFSENRSLCLFMQRVLLEEHETYSPIIAKVLAQTARFIAKIVDDGRARGEFRADLDPTVTARAMLGMVAGATQQHLASPSHSLASLLQEMRAMALARVLA